MRKTATALAVLLAPVAAFAGSTTVSPSTRVATAQTCVEYTVITAGTRIDTSPSFDVQQSNPMYPLVTVMIKNVDANSSVTTWQSVCTVSSDNSTTDYTPQTTTVSAGVATLNSAGTFQKASPGSLNFPFSFDLLDMPDFECTITAAAGSAAAADTLTGTVRMCTR